MDSRLRHRHILYMYLYVANIGGKSAIADRPKCSTHANTRLDDFLVTVSVDVSCSRFDCMMSPRRRRLRDVDSSNSSLGLG